MEVNKMKFGEFKELNNEGIVLLGCGGDLQEWINGIGNLFNEEKITTSANPKDIFINAIELTTTGGRTDLALLFNNDYEFNMGKMAMWRLSFGDCSWVSDYIVNYAGQHDFYLAN